VAGVLERIGYDAVLMRGLGAGRLLQPGGSVFGVSLSRREFEQAVLTSAEVGGASDPTVAGTASTTNRKKDLT
jgi:8-hydroxy-5-deazaflavin:NADPH oxidoreductase